MVVRHFITTTNIQGTTLMDTFYFLSFTGKQGNLDKYATTDEKEQAFFF